MQTEIKYRHTGSAAWGHYVYIGCTPQYRIPHTNTLDNREMEDVCPYVVCVLCDMVVVMVVVVVVVVCVCVSVCVCVFIEMDILLQRTYICIWYMKKYPYISMLSSLFIKFKK